MQLDGKKTNFLHVMTYATQLKRKKDMRRHDGDDGSIQMLSGYN